MRTIEEITSAMTALVDGAANRSLTDDEVAQYEGMEKELKASQATEQIRTRNAAYNVVRTPAGVPSRVTPTQDGRDELDLAFANYLRTGVPNQDIAGLRVTNAQGEGSTTAGGYLVPSGFRQKLVEVRKSFGGFAAETDSFDTGDGAPIEYPSVDDTANVGDITAESAAITSGNDLVFGTVTLGAYKYTSAGAGSNLPLRVPVELLQDSAFDVESLVARKLGERIARKQAAHWVTGTGSSQPKGILASSLTQDNDLDVADVIDYDDIMDTYDLLDAAYEPNAKWLMKKNTWSQIRGIVDLNGRPLVQDALSGISGTPEKRLLGFPVIIDEGTPTLSSAGITFPVAFGDFREAYVIRRVSSLVVVVNPYTRAANGEVEFSAWERADGNIQNRSAYVIVRNNT
jgi:HK97 family phage major capsid protein